MSETRRDRLRRELTQQILDIASQQLADQGAGGVSWRGIAREVGMNPASLYTYFNGMDDLYTALILQGFHSLAAAVGAASEATIQDDPEDHVVACVSAYRAWAVDNPAQFNLVFSDQIPGYVAPPDGPTVDAEVAVFQPLGQALGRLLGRDYDVSDFDELTTQEQDHLMNLYGLVHGLVSLEVNHHLPPGPDHSARFEHRVREALRTTGSALLSAEADS